MRARQSLEHKEAVGRRLALLRAELAEPGAPEPEPDATSLPVDWWAGRTRVPGAPVAPPEPTVDHPGGTAAAASTAGTVPVPGRHASRRSGAAPAMSWWPAALRGRVHLTPWHVALVAVLVAAALAVCCWRFVRADPELIRQVSSSAGAPAAPPDGSPAPSGSAAAPLVDLGPAASGGAGAAAAASGATVTIDVIGKVRTPGVLVLPAGSRVVDALEAAGGVRRGADLTALNQARLLVDGEQLAVGVPVAAGGAVVGEGQSGGASTGGAGASASGEVPGAPVSLNTATAAELEGLPEVGPVMAAAIVQYRTEHGGFRSVDELMEVTGIGEKTLAQIAPHVTL